MELRQDSSDHIKADITAEQQRRRRELIDDARNDAEHEIARREHQAHEDGTVLLNNQKQSADKLAEHRYNRQRNDIKESLREEKQELKDELKRRVWEKLLEECEDDTIIDHLKHRVKQATDDEDYQMTTTTTGQDYTVTATTNTKKYRASLNDIVEDIITNYWDTAIRK